jgi:hypothetical protein
MFHCRVTRLAVAFRDQSRKRRGVMSTWGVIVVARYRSGGAGAILQMGWRGSEFE